jgi:hypothetical protein
MSSMRALWQAWTRVARRIGDVQARIMLTLFYYTVLGPFAVVLRMRGGGLPLRPGRSGGWHRRDEQGPSALDRARRQS